MTHASKCGLVLMLVALLVAAAVIPLLASASPGTGALRATASRATVRFAPQEDAIAVGETITLAVMVDDVQDMYAVDVQFSFDPTMLSVPAASVVVNQELFPAGSLTLTNYVDNAAGQGSVVVTKMNPDAPFTGSGKVCDVTFQGVADGYVAVEFVEARPATRDGEDIENVTVNAILEVGDGGPTPTPSPTPRPVGGDKPYNVAIPVIVSQ